MAITSTNFTLTNELGTESNTPHYTVRMSMTGDTAYATGGSAAVQAAVASKLGKVAVDIKSISGYGLTAGAITHFVIFDDANDKLVVYVLAGTQVPNATNLGAVTFDLTILCR